MRRGFFFVLLIGLLTSCSIEDDAGNIMQNLAPTLSVNLPETFVFGQTYTIEITYQRPTNCHTFSGLDVARNENEIVIGVVTSYSSNNPNCAATGNLQATATINFVAERDDFYIFKFWKGKSATGIDQFLIVEVPVTL
ncbi:MAG TPA: hypothetical protein VLN46_03035 [Gillisia sp.]|nr:hypothetical protein [Gillisia sp.]